MEGARCEETAIAIVDGHCEDASALVTEADESTRDHLIDKDVKVCFSFAACDVWFETMWYLFSDAIDVV